MNIPILTTGYYDLEKYEPIGLINSVSVHSISLIRGIFSSITSIFGGQQTLIEQKYKDIRDQAIGGLIQEGKLVGAVLIIGLDVEVSEIAGEFMVYVASGTALKYKNTSLAMVAGSSKKINKKTPKLIKEKTSKKTKK
jgi:uncharacterized protein YbjQ (UPF0145 family)